ncbi:response regulator [Sphingosinicellaceae bacterium]|nr:response regulator [Sphingosinicellaceae bacterium]
MGSLSQTQEVSSSILVVDGDIVSRHAIAHYLRHCGYDVVEAGNTDEAMTALDSLSMSIDVILCDVAAIGSRSAFELANWVRKIHPALEVRLAGSIDKAAKEAAELCETGPHLARPYEPQAVVDYIKRLRAARERA